jgi:ATP-dependent RNA helicase DHX57
MLILGAIFRCLDPILTIAAGLSSKPLFFSPMDKREEANKFVGCFPGP